MVNEGNLGLKPIDCEWVESVVLSKEKMRPKKMLGDKRI